MDALLEGLANLGPALGSVAVLGVILWRVLQFIEKGMEKMTDAIQRLSENVARNTEAQEHMSSIIEQQYEYVPRKS